MSLMNSMVEQMARTAHEINKAFCAIHGDVSHKSWDESPENIKQSAINGVNNILEGKVTSPRESHESWLEFKRAEGYVYGPTKDNEAKTHPCLVEYDDLSDFDKGKDVLFFASVLSWLPR